MDVFTKFSHKVICFVFVHEKWAKDEKKKTSYEDMAKQMMSRYGTALAMFVVESTLGEGLINSFATIKKLPAIAILKNKIGYELNTKGESMEHTTFEFKSSTKQASIMESIASRLKMIVPVATFEDDLDIKVASRQIKTKADFDKLCLGHRSTKVICIVVVPAKSEFRKGLTEKDFTSAFRENILSIGSHFAQFHLMWGFGNTLGRQEIMGLDHGYFADSKFPIAIGYDTELNVRYATQDAGKTGADLAEHVRAIMWHLDAPKQRRTELYGELTTTNVDLQPDGTATDEPNIASNDEL